MVTFVSAFENRLLVKCAINVSLNQIINEYILVIKEYVPTSSRWAASLGSITAFEVERAIPYDSVNTKRIDTIKRKKSPY